MYILCKSCSQQYVKTNICENLIISLRILLSWKWISKNPVVSDEPAVGLQCVFPAFQTCLLLKKKRNRGQNDVRVCLSGNTRHWYLTTAGEVSANDLKQSQSIHVRWLEFKRRQMVLELGYITCASPLMHFTPPSSQDLISDLCRLTSRHAWRTHKYLHLNIVIYFFWAVEKFLQGLTLHSTKTPAFDPASRWTAICFWPACCFRASASCQLQAKAILTKIIL